LFITFFVVYLYYNNKTNKMKTRLMTNKENDSFRLDVIDNNIHESYFFKTKKAALDFQKFTTDLDKYKEFI